MRTGLAAFCGSLLLAGCGSAGAEDGSSRASGLEVSRADGSRVDLPDSIQAWCGRFDDIERGANNSPDLSLHLVGGELPVERGGEEPPVFWLYSQRLRALERESSVDLADAPSSGAVMFVYDTETENELATDVAGSAGTVVVKEWGCEPGDAVRISFDGTLGSEFGDGPSVTIEGDVEAEIGEPPPLPQ